MYTDDILTAYLDSETSLDLTTEIKEALANNPDLDARLNALSLEKQALISAFDPLLGLANTRSLQHRLECASSHEAANRNKEPNGFFKAASYCAAAVIGAVLSWTYFATPVDWRMEVAHYQALYVSETLSPIVPDDARLQIEFARASAALEMPLDPSSFTGIDGLTLRRAQVLGFGDAALVQVAFTLGDGTPFAFCIVKKDGVQSPLTGDTLVGLASAFWQSETYGFLAIGGDNDGFVMDVAKEISKRI